MSNLVATTKRNVDRDGNTVAIKIYETRRIAGDGFITLKQIPDELNRVKIENYIEVDGNNLKSNEFKVDYAQGIVYFNITRLGEFVDIEYYGMGMSLYM